MSELVATPTKKRKLRHPRTLNACTFCKKRKVRCSGTIPCDVCVENEVNCEYPEGLTPTRSSGKNTASLEDNTAATTSLRAALLGSSSPNVSTVETPRSSAKYHSGDAVDLAVGTSFLYHGLSDMERQHDEPNPELPDGTIGSDSVPLTSHGDAVYRSSSDTSTFHQPFQPGPVISGLLEQYFQYICPTYRFLHQPTVVRWAQHYVKSEALAPSEHACLLLVCAQTLLHQKRAVPGAKQSTRELSESCLQKAKSLLSEESSPPLLSSVQARLAMCLYLLSTFRLTECRFSFSHAITITMMLGLHRVDHQHQDDLLATEARRRTFWSAYVLDGYLSVMLGQPKLLKDEDINQSFPRNIDDDLLDTPVPVDQLPHHGNIEAFIAHAKLAQLMARNDSVLYPLITLSTGQILENSSQTLRALQNWQDGLPTFLQARNKTYTGLRTFARQNTILKLAAAHVHILASRKAILLDEPQPGLGDVNLAHVMLLACLQAVQTVLSTVDELITHGQCYDAFWTTQYIGLVALSTLYVYIIQAQRGKLIVELEPDGVHSIDLDEAWSVALRCHEHLAGLPPRESHAARHHVLLARLRETASRARENRHDASALLSSQQHSDEQTLLDTGGIADAQLTAEQASMNEGNDALVTMTNMLDWSVELPDFTWSSFDVIG